MHCYQKNKKYFFAAILLLAITLNFFAPPTASAQTISTLSNLIDRSNPLAIAGSYLASLGSNIALKMSAAISEIIGSFFGLVIYLESLIIDYLLSPNFSFTTAPVVKVGWEITRDLANMFFILILLIIAFATVLRIQSYALNQLLWKVVVAAILINFSLVIAGFVIDFTQVLTKFFVNGITGNGSLGSITTQLAFNMKITNFYKPNTPESLGQGIAQLGSSSIAAVVGIILTLVGGVVMVFVFGATAIFLVVRIINLWGLLIVAPIAWILWILPATSGQFQKWWNSFIRWAFFAPIYTFFIYLAMQIFDRSTGAFKKGTFTGDITNNLWNTAGPGLTQASMPAAIFQWILVIAIMFYALIYANEFGIMGAKTSYAMLKGWGDKSKGWAGRQTRRGLLAVGAKKAEVDAQGKIIKPAKPGLLQRGAEKVAALPGGKLLTGAVFKQVEAEAKSVEDAQKQLAGWSPEALKNLSSARGVSAPTQIGAALALKDKGKLGDLGEDKIRKLITLAARYSPKNVDKLLEVALHLAPEFGKKITDIAKKIEKAEQIMLESLGKAEVVLNLNPNQLRDIAQKANDAKVQEVKNVVNIAFANLQATSPTAASKIEARIMGVGAPKPPSKDERNKVLRELEEEERAGTVPVGTADIARAKFLTSSPAWDI